MQLSPVLVVAAGSAIGGVARYLVGLSLAPRAGAFPVGTLAVNIAGCFLIGVFARLLGDPNGSGSSATWLFLAVGLCGGFTTFSAFGLDVVRLAHAGAHARAAVYVGASLGLSIAAVYLGMLAGRVALDLSGG